MACVCIATACIDLKTLNARERGTSVEAKKKLFVSIVFFIVEYFLAGGSFDVFSF